MTETWLQSNRRAIAFGAALPVAFAIVSLGLWLTAGEVGWIRWASLAFGGLALLLMVLLAAQWRRPRLAYRDGVLLVYLRTGEPIKVPIEAVEAFFLGRGPTLLPGPQNRELKTSNLVVRIAQRAVDYAERDVKPALGLWSEGYITIRGTWCEPLSVEVANRLNRRLAEVKRELAERTPQEQAP